MFANFPSSDTFRGQKTILTQQIQGIAPQAVRVRFWENGKLIFYTVTEDRDVFFRFDPETNNIDTTMNTLTKPTNFHQ
ncbi:hypothetical protein [Paenibacillus sp. J2TS4]|uniref:hypothetical protein n=1 Tax=Paenibacillus sp. J2TS4 TaxID=2807194 RepID=UPI001BCC5DB9|nr:hypothetical protein [Paenibacillus sp. J2TS4]